MRGISNWNLSIIIVAIAVQWTSSVGLEKRAEGDSNQDAQHRLLSKEHVRARVQKVPKDEGRERFAASVTAPNSNVEQEAYRPTSLVFVSYAKDGSVTVDFPDRVKQTLVYVCAAILAVLGLVVVRVASTRSASSESTEDKSITSALPSLAVWISLGITLICFNKYLYMKPEQGGFGFPCPVALTWWHMLVGTILTNIVRVCKPDWMPAVQEGRMDLNGFVKGVIPIGIVFSSYLAIGNSAYLYLSVAFLQMLRSAGPLAVHTIACLVGIESLTVTSVTSISIVAIGVLAASVGEIRFSWFGAGLQFCAFILDGIRLVLLKMLMSSKGSKLDPLSGLFYYSPVCVIALAGPVWYFEGAKLMTVYANVQPKLIYAIILNGLNAFALNASLMALFANVSPTTVSVGSVVRDIVLTFSSAALFHTELTTLQIFGYLISVLGVKLWDEMKARPGAFEEAIMKPLRLKKDELA